MSGRRIAAAVAGMSSSIGSSRRSPPRSPQAAAAHPGARPFQGLTRNELLRRFNAALASRDGLPGAHCVHELWMRGEWPANIERALSLLWQHAAPSIPDWLPMRYIDWLPLLYEVTATFQPARSGRTNIYLILLDYADRNSRPLGVYVGMSRYTPAQRFDQHKAGIRVAGCVLKRGLEVLTGPALHLQWIARSEAARIEAGLAAALLDSGLRTAGGH
jgi:hypothetical protein